MTFVNFARGGIVHSERGTDGKGIPIVLGPCEQIISREDVSEYRREQYREILRKINDMTEQPTPEELDPLPDEEVVELPAVDDFPPDFAHPDEVTEEEAEEGHIVYLEVDDTDDDSNGIDL